MATFVASYTTNDGATGATHQVTSVSVQAGDGIFVFSKWEDSATTCSFTDSGGNSYTTHQTVTSASGPCAAIGSAVAAGAGTLTITATTGVSVVWRRSWVMICRPAGGKTFVYDNSAGASGTSTTPASGSYAVDGVGGFAVAGVAEYSEGTFTAGTGWTEQIDATYFGEYRVLTTQTSINGNCTWTQNSQWVALSAAFVESSGGTTISISATSSTGIQYWTGPFQLVGITKTLPILLGESRFEGFAASSGFGRQADILLGLANAEGFTPSIAKAVTILLGETRAQGFAAQNIAIIRTFLGLLGELRALGFNASSEPIQNANVGLGSVYFTGIAGSVSTVAPVTTITASALLRETQAVGFIGQVIKVVFPITGTVHFDGYGAQTLEFIKVISGPDIGEMRAEGIAATALIGQIRNYTISLGEVGFYALQQALTIQRTLDILVGQTNYTGIEPSLAIIRGGEINLGPQIGVVTLEGLINAAAKIERTGFIGSGLATAEGFGLTAPAGQLSLQSVLGEAYASGQIPLVSFNRFFAQLGQAYASGFAPDITYGLWRPIKRRLTTWAAI